MNNIIKLYKNGYSNKNLALAMLTAIKHCYGYLDDTTWCDLYYDLYYHMYDNISHILYDCGWLEEVEKLSSYPEDEELVSKTLNRISDQGWPTKPAIFRKFESDNTVTTTFTFNYQSYDWESNPKMGRCLVELEDGSNIKFTVIRGADPMIDQVASIIYYVASKTAAIHRYNRCNRIWPYKINLRYGYSGCIDYSLDLYKKRGSLFIKKARVATLHQTMYRKVCDFSMYIGDALELLLAASVGVNREYDFRYDRKKTKSLKKYGITRSRLYADEIIYEEDELTFIPPSSDGSCRRPSRRG